MRRISVRMIKTALRLRYESGLSHREIGRSLRVSHTTVGECFRRFDASELSWDKARELSEGGLTQALYPEQPRPSDKFPTPDFSYLHSELRKTGVTLRLLWEEYRDTHPCGYGYSRFCELYGVWTKSLKVWMRQVHTGGEKLFVDYSGKKPEVVNRHTGEVREVELFVASWGASHYTYAEAQESQKLPCFLMGHVRAFEYFGCASHLVVPDNLKSGVTKAHRYDPDVNMSYEEMCAHYGTAVLPARPVSPKDKAKVETGVQIVQRWILARLRHRTFFSIAELNEAIGELLPELNRRPMQKLGVSRSELFEKLDRPAALRLPSGRYEYREWTRATVGLDYHIEVKKHYYSVPYILYGKRLEVRLGESALEVMHRGERVALHRRSSIPHGYSTRTEHMPESHRKHLQWTPARIIRWAGSAGTNTEALVKKVIASKAHPEQGFRPALGIKRLGDAFGTKALEKACAYALERNIKRVAPIKNILKKRLYMGTQETSPGTVVIKSNVRGITYYHPKGETEHESSNSVKAARTQTGAHGSQDGGTDGQSRLHKTG